MIKWPGRLQLPAYQPTPQPAWVRKLTLPVRDIPTVVPPEPAPVGYPPPSYTVPAGWRLDTSPISKLYDVRKRGDLVKEMDWRTGNEIPVVGPSFSEQYGLGMDWPAEQYGLGMDTPRTEPASPQEQDNTPEPVLPTTTPEQELEGLRRALGNPPASTQTINIPVEDVSQGFDRIRHRPRPRSPRGAFSYRAEVGSRKRNRVEEDASGRFPGSSTDAA